MATAQEEGFLVSIHAPVKGATKMATAQEEGFLFQSTLP